MTSHETFIPPTQTPDLAAMVDEFEQVSADDITSDLQALSDELNSELFPPVTLPVPARPGWGIKIRTDLTLKEVNAWRKSAGKDEIRGALLHVVNATIGIVHNGAVLVLDEETMLFGSPEFQQLLRLDQVPAVECARRFIGRDGDISALAVAVMQASGFGSSVESMTDDETDPTSRPGGKSATGH